MAKKTINLEYKVNSKSIKDAVNLLTQLKNVIEALDKKGIKIKAEIK